MRAPSHGSGGFPAVFCAFAAILSFLPAGPGSAFADSPVVFTQVPVAGVASLSSPGGLRIPPDTAAAGSRIVLLDLSNPEAGVENLTPEFAAAADPEVSFDGESILFAGKKKSSDPWQIWEKPIAGGEARRVVEGFGNCREPVYTGMLNTLNAPEWDQILFVSDAPGTWNENGSGPSTALYTCKTDGTEVHRITYNLSSDFGPVALADGRILFTSWQGNGNRFSPAGILPLMTVFSDGTDMMPFFGNHEPPILRHQPAEAPDRSVYFIEADGDAWGGGGDLARVSLRRPLYTREVLAQDALYLSPAVSPEGDLLVASWPSGEYKSYGIYRFDPESKKRVETVFDTAEFHEIDPKFVAPRAKPNGRSTVVNYEKDTGWFFCLDASMSDRPEGENIEPDEIKRVRFIEGIPPSGEADVKTPTGVEEPGGNPVYDRRRIIADFPVDEDGSISVQVPVLTPMFLQTVDKDGLSLQTCRTWLWVMPMERNGCIGCHEDRERTPPNRFVLAAQRPPRDLDLPPDKRRTVDFRRDVMPLIDANCLGSGCHDAGAHLDLSAGSEPASLGEEGPVFNKAYTALLSGKGSSGRRYVVPGDSGKSLLAWKLVGRESLGGETVRGTPHPDPPLSEFDRLTFIEWIDLGARWTNLEEDKTP